MNADFSLSSVKKWQLQAAENRLLRFAGGETIRQTQNEVREEPKTENPEKKTEVRADTPEGLQKDVREKSDTRRTEAEETANRQSNNMEKALNLTLKRESRKNPNAAQDHIEKWNKAHEKQGLVLTFDGKEARIHRAKEQGNLQILKKETAWPKIAQIAQRNPQMMAMYKELTPQLEAYAKGQQGQLNLPKILELHNRTMAALVDAGVSIDQIQASRPRTLDESIAFAKTVLGVSEGRNKEMTRPRTEKPKAPESPRPAQAPNVSAQASVPPEKILRDVQKVVRPQESGSTKPSATPTQQPPEDSTSDEGDTNEKEATPEEQARYEQNRSELSRMMADCNSTIPTAKTEQDLASAEGKIQAINEICTKSGMPPEAIQAVTGILRSAMDTQRIAIQQAGSLYKDASERLQILINGKKGNVAETKKEQNKLGLVAWVSGVSKGVQKTLDEDQRSLNDALAAQKEMEQYKDPVRTPQDRIAGIKGAMKQALKMTNYSDANEQLASAAAALDAVDKNVRAYADMVPGGSLGIALADARINPSDPDNARKLTGALALTALDLIPIPGGKAAGKGLSKGLRRATVAGARTVENKTLRKAIITTGKVAAAVGERAVIRQIKKGAKASTNLAFDAGLGKTAEKKAKEANPNKEKKGIGRNVAGIILDEAMSELKIPGGKKLAKFSQGLVDKAGKRLSDAVKEKGKVVVAEGLKKVEGKLKDQVKKGIAQTVDQGLAKNPDKKHQDDADNEKRKEKDIGTGNQIA